MATLIALTLRNEVGPISRRVIRERVQLAMPSVRDTTMYVVFNRMEDEGVITGLGSDSVTLVNKQDAPGLIDGRVWGPPTAFASQEVAVHRREGILAALEEFGPLLKSEFVDGLKASEWVHASLVDSLISNDLKFLYGKGLIRRAKETDQDFRWELVPTVDAPQVDQKGQAKLRLA